MRYDEIYSKIYTILHNSHQIQNMMGCIKSPENTTKELLGKSNNKKKDLCTPLPTFRLSGCTFALCLKSTQLECLQAPEQSSALCGHHFATNLAGSDAWCNL